MSYCYENALSWAYQQADNPLPKEDIENRTFLLTARQSILKAFLDTSICGAMSVKNCLFQSLNWNELFLTIKGGLDKITKLLWLNMYDTPCNTPQSHAVARMLLLGNVVVHRLCHFFTAKVDSSSYPSL
jgi:hypothetical protein